MTWYYANFHCNSSSHSDMILRLERFNSYPHGILFKWKDKKKLYGIFNIFLSIQISGFTAWNKIHKCQYGNIKIWRRGNKVAPHTSSLNNRGRIPPIRYILCIFSRMSQNNACFCKTKRLNWEPQKMVCQKNITLLKLLLL